MFKRTFKIVYRPVKNNFVVLPENYFKVVSTYDTGCLSLQYNAHIHYAFWAPNSGAVKETEIAINARVAKEIGLNENDMVKCTLVADAPLLKNVFVTPVSAKDWEIIELSSEKISESVLDQTRIINSNQMLIIWINKSMQVALTVDRVKPSYSHGRIDHTTELVVAPNLCKGITNGNDHDNGVDKNDKLYRSNTVAQLGILDEDSHTQRIKRSTTASNIKNLQRSQSLAKTNRRDKMERLKRDLNRELSKFIEFRAISGEWKNSYQISDVFVNKANWPSHMDTNTFYSLKTMNEKEYYVKVRLVTCTEIAQTVHPTIEMNVNLMKILDLKELEKVLLKPKPNVVNFVEKIELFANKKTHYKVIENAFKRYVIGKTQHSSMLLNQNEVVRLEEDLIVSVGILPEHFRYCAIDSQFLKESKIYAADLVRKVDDIVDVAADIGSPLSVKDLIKLPQFDKTVEKLTTELKSNLCLDAKNGVLRQGNILITGASGTGKSVVVERILDELIRKPYYCYFDLFYCTRSKGRKAESIQKDLRNLFTTCLQNAPSIVVLENLDVLAHATSDQATPDAEYYNRIADIVHQLIVQYTSNHPIAVIATVNEVQSLNKRLYSPRGRHLFQTIKKLPNLERTDRALVLKDLCAHIDAEKLDLDRYALLTEGYNKGDLVQFVERAIFYAYRISKSQPVLTNDHLRNSLENTNSYCLQGIESHQPNGNSADGDDSLAVEDIPGVESVISVLEEVLMWPAKYPTIFNDSPLRNQAGVLLYGPPGTGKTFLVSKLANSWNLRTISVKGPELLAKYIGQSEENVRNLFNRARSAKPCVLFFDEFDSLAPKRGHDSTGVTDRVVNQLLTELDGVEGLQGVTVIAATSRPELLDPALLRSGRIDRLVECALPDVAARLAIFETLSSSLILDESVDFDYFAEKTQNYTGADIQSILTSANMLAVKEAIVDYGHECGLSKSFLPAEDFQQIMLKADILQTLHLREGLQLDIVCPFTQPIWYHNEQYLHTNRTFKIKTISLEKAGLYSCLSQIPNKEENDHIKWANVSLNVCNNFTKENICKLTEIKLQNLKEDFNKNHNPKPLTKEPIVTITSDQVDNLEENLYEPPKFKFNQLYNTTQKYSGGTAIFNCYGYSQIATNISWTFNNRSLDSSNSAKYKIKKWTLAVQDLQSQDSGEYACTICNIYGCIYRASVLNVLERESSPPVIREGTVSNQTVMADENVKFECDVISALEPHIVWYYHTDFLNFTGDQAFDSAYNPNALKLLTRLDEPYILRLGSVQDADQGWYSCIAANSLGEAVASFYLSVLTEETFLNDTLEPEGDIKNLAITVPSVEFNTLNLEQTDNDESLDHDTDNKNSGIEEEKPPQFKNLNKLVDHMHKPSGSSIQLVCPANGHPIPNITWTRNNTEIERHIGKVSYKKWSIQMDDAITKDSGVYKCTVCNALGCIEHSTKVTVSDRLRSRPIISDKFPQNQTVLTNSSTYLECRVVSDLEPYIVWLKYTKRNESIEKLEKVVPNFSNDQRLLSNDVVILERDQDKPNILNFTKVSHEDEGWYTCVAASSLGQTVASAYLKVVDKLPQRDVLQRSHPVTITAVAIVVVLLFLLGTIFVIYVMRNLKHEKLLKQRIETVHQWTKKVIIYKPPPSEGGSCDLQMPVIKIEKQRTTFTTSSNSDPSQGFNEYEFPLDSNWEIARSQLSLGSTLGEGAFGRVVMAQGSSLPRVSSNGAATTIVAVKMVKEEHTDADMASLVREMEVMKMIGKHINIINLLGCCSQNGPLWVIVEFAPHGNLKDFLKKNRPLSNWGSCSLKRNSEYMDDKTHLTEKHLISFAFQIARGMEYLASRRCIHRDLAARNVLVSDDYVMKIADFGLARDIQDTDYYRKNTNGRLPIKWMAPESLQEKFYDSQSDVWSYGVLLWEIMTYGEQPYPNIMSAEELYSYLITGQRMEKPPRCSLNIYMLMRQCWHFDSTARPTFTEIVENLDKILQLTSTTSNEEYLDLSMPMLETPPSSSDEDSDVENFRENSLRYQYTYKFN